MMECCGGKACSYFNDTYKERIYLFVGSGEQLKQYLAEKHNCKDYEVNPEFVGEVIVLHDKKTNRICPLVIWLKTMEFVTSEYATLAHECLHAAVRILHWRGIPTGKDGSDEALAYLFDTIYENFLKQLHHDRKKAEAMSDKVK